MTRQRLLVFAKWAVYFILLMFLHVLQSMPGFLSLFGIKPVLLVGAAISLSLFEGFSGSIFGGLIAGFYLEFGSGRLSGSLAFPLVILLVAFSELFSSYFRPRLRAVLLLGSAVIFLLLSIDFLFYYAIFSYEKVYLIYLRQTLPTIAYSILAIIPLYFLFRKLHQLFVHNLPTML